MKTNIFLSYQSTSMSNTWGPMKLVSNGESFMEFDMRLESYNIIGKKVSERWKNYHFQNLSWKVLKSWNIWCRAEIGVWSASSPPAPIAFSAGGAQKITRWQNKSTISAWQVENHLESSTTSCSWPFRSQFPREDGLQGGDRCPASFHDVERHHRWWLPGSYIFWKGRL